MSSPSMTSPVALGVLPGERVFLLLGAMLGALKARRVVTPLFSAFGPEPIATRMEIGDEDLREAREKE